MRILSGGKGMTERESLSEGKFRKILFKEWRAWYNRNMSFADKVFVSNVKDILEHGYSDSELAVRPH